MVLRIGVNEKYKSNHQPYLNPPVNLLYIGDYEEEKQKRFQAVDQTQTGSTYLAAVLEGAFSGRDARTNQSWAADTSQDRERLIEWARLNGFVIEQDVFSAWQSGREKAGLALIESSEVDVFRANAGYVIKVTKGDEYGYDLNYGHAGPASTYLQWLKNSNDLLGDTVDFCGVVQQGEPWNIVTCQQFINPHSSIIPTDAMIESAMHDAGYQLIVMGLKAGFSSPERNAFVWDAGANNFILNTSKQLAPIDVHPVPLDVSLPMKVD